MLLENLKLGSTVRDVVTQFNGVATGICQYISGCTQVLVTPSVDSDGKLKTAEWFDIQRLDLVGNDYIVLDNYLVPGFDKEAPKR